MKSSSGKRGSWEEKLPDREYGPKEKGRMERGDFQKDGDNINPSSDYRKAAKKRDFNLSEQNYDQKNNPGRRKNAARDEGDEYDETRENDNYNRQYRESVGGRDASLFVTHSGRAGYGGRIKRNK